MDFFGPSELLIIGVIAVLLYGQRLPEVGRKVGRIIAEVKRTMQGFQDQINSATSAMTSTLEGTVNSGPTSSSSSSSSSNTANRYVDEVDDYEEATAPKFEPPKHVASSPAAASEPSRPVPAPPAKP